MIPGVLTAAGIAMSIVPSTIAATQGAKEGQAGLASGLVNTSRQVGGGLGLAVLITLATQHTSNLIGDGVQVTEALTRGFRLAYFIARGLCAAAALMTFVAVPGTGRGARARVAAAVPAVVGVVLLAFVGAERRPSKATRARRSASTRPRARTASSPRPSLHPPDIKRVQAARRTRGLAPGYIFAANFYDLNKPPIVGQSGPLILDRDLQPVWFQPVPEKRRRLQPQPAELPRQAGARLVAGARSRTRARPKAANDVVVDQHYQPVAQAARQRTAGC